MVIIVPWTMLAITIEPKIIAVAMTVPSSQPFASFILVGSPLAETNRYPVQIKASATTGILILITISSTLFMKSNKVPIAGVGDASFGPVYPSAKTLFPFKKETSVIAEKIMA